LSRRRCHQGTCWKTSAQRASCRCRSAGILAAPEQQHPTLAGTRNSSTTCLYHCGQNQQTCLKCLILLVVCNFSPSDSNGQTSLKLPGKVYCRVLHLGEGPGADCALFSGRQWSLNGA
jgi:hypothetical protein